MCKKPYNEKKAKKAVMISSKIEGFSLKASSLKASKKTLREAQRIIALHS